MSPKIAKQIQDEQRHGRQKYGTGPSDFAHDDQHTQSEWQDMIEDNTAMLVHATPQEYRQRLIKIAGLAVSAIESFDRKDNYGRQIQRRKSA